MKTGKNEAMLRSEFAYDTLKGGTMNFIEYEHGKIWASIEKGKLRISLADEQGKIFGYIDMSFSDAIKWFKRTITSMEESLDESRMR